MTCPGVEQILPRSELLRATGMADFLTVLTPLEARTRHLVGTSAPNTIVSPHIGGRSDCYTEQVLPVLLENMHCYLSGRIQDMQNAAPIG